MSALEERADQVRTRERLLATLDPDAEDQRWYTCSGCGWPCINPVGTVPERWDLCLDCATERVDAWDF